MEKSATLVKYISYSKTCDSFDSMFCYRNGCVGFRNVEETDRVQAVLMMLLVGLLPNQCIVPLSVTVRIHVNYVPII